MRISSFDRRCFVIRKFIFIVGFIIFSSSMAFSQNFTVTTTASPSQVGTISGAGTYPSGTQVTANIQPAFGWYISNVLLNGQQANSFFRQYVTILLTRGGDLTTITNDTENFTINSNTIISATFAPLFPTITEQPTNTAAVTGGSVTFEVQASGRTNFTYQWQFNGTNLPGATTNPLTLSNVQSANAGNYSAVISNAFGMTNSVGAVLSVEDLLVLVNDQAVTNGTISVIGQPSITLNSLFSNGTIFYTLDGSQPDFNGNLYSGSFSLPASCTLRAIAYSGDFSQSALSAPVNISVTPTYYAFVDVPGGGTVTLNPSDGPYLSGTTVTLVATPDAGFSFMGWSGGLSGTNLTNSFVITENTQIQALFGTTINTTATGNGTVALRPNTSIYPYGSTVQMTAVPTPGSYFVLWGNAASGSQNPLWFYVNSANPTVSALFSTLPTNTCSLTVLIDGNGTVSANPSTNKYVRGSTCVLTANPPFGQQFTGWSGDATGTANPLTVTMNTNKVIAAHFSHPTSLSLQNTGANAQISISGIWGDAYQIQTSTNLITWTNLATNIPNFFGNTTFTDSSASNQAARFYRILIQ